MKESSLLLLSEGETSSSSKTMNPGTPHISPNHPSTSSKLEVDFVILLPQLLFITLLEFFFGIMDPNFRNFINSTYEDYHGYLGFTKSKLKMEMENTSKRNGKVLYISHACHDPSGKLPFFNKVYKGTGFTMMHRLRWNPLSSELRDALMPFVSDCIILIIQCIFRAFWSYSSRAKWVVVCDIFGITPAFAVLIIIRSEISVTVHALNFFEITVQMGILKIKVCGNKRNSHVYIFCTKDLICRFRRSRKSVINPLAHLHLLFVFPPTNQ
ncbi:hypothetical protein EGR_06577 [Echinococcus granulosus]|uniref:Transmembrane protein n=1 Tax=Echinococcus granulosus TaxID=6210 RepID=W6UBU3_ECHGR|nr:hypothetical protein EGR_06577 [Echinococcus granulosus]EUB58590.1 hypothetical protein EGR_06577 [Echinococcus granulosus]